MNAIHTPGYGDAQTWSPCLGHGLDPRTDDDALSEDEARDIAANELMHTPYALAWALNNDMGIDDADLQVDVDTVCRPELVADDASNAELLAVLLNSYCRDTVYAAARELAQRVERAMAGQIAVRAVELQRAAERVAA